MIGLAKGQGLNLEETDYWNKRKASLVQSCQKEQKGGKVKDDEEEEFSYKLKLGGIKKEITRQKKNEHLYWSKNWT